MKNGHQVRIEERPLSKRVGRWDGAVCSYMKSSPNGIEAAWYAMQFEVCWRNLTNVFDGVIKRGFSSHKSTTNEWTLGCAQLAPPTQLIDLMKFNELSYLSSRVTIRASHNFIKPQPFIIHLFDFFVFCKQNIKLIIVQTFIDFYFCWFLFVN